MALYQVSKYENNVSYFPEHWRQPKNIQKIQEAFLKAAFHTVQSWIKTSCHAEGLRILFWNKWSGKEILGKMSLS